MDTGMISRRYATALWLYAEQHGVSDKVYTESGLLARAYIQFPALGRVLSNRMITAEKKRELLATMAGGMTVSDVFRHFIRFVFRQEREEFLRTICLHYQEIYRREKKILQVELTTATPIGHELEQRITEHMEKETTQHVTLTSKTDPSLIGGFKLHWDTYRLDESVATKLQRIKKQLTEKRF